MKKKLLTLLLIGMMIFACTSCTILGKWVIKEVSAGDVVMSEDDINSMGMDAGFIKLNKSGSCVVNLLGDEYDGTYTEDNGTLSITYGDDMSGTATIKDDVMTFTDAQGANYTLEK